MKKGSMIFMTILCILSLCLTNVSAKEKALSWYCKRNNDHMQPSVDTNMSFIEEYGGYYVDKNHSANNDEKVIYLTFDAGYENGNIERILDTLKEENVKASFFILKNLMSKDPELVLRMEKEGHLVCNHTSTHVDITKLPDIDALKAELSALEAQYTALTGKPMAKCFRPPEGKFDRKSMQMLNELGYKTVFWSFAYADWDNAKQLSKESAKKKIFDNFHNGEIMLLHPTSETNAKIMKEVIVELKNQGYSFMTLESLKS